MKKRIALLSCISAVVVTLMLCNVSTAVGFFSASAFASSSQTINETYLSEKFDARDYGWVPAVKDQGNTNICWAYASTNASEVSILRNGIDNSTAETLSLSPVNLAYARHNRTADPLNNTIGEYTNQPFLTTAGDPQYSATVFSQWCGPTAEGSQGTQNQWYNAKYHLNNAVHISNAGITNIKKAIIQYGAVTFAYNNRRETPYHNPKNEPSGESYTHACTIIGWDDTIPASNFVPNGASQNGGWLIKNSYNSLPYFYISYDTVNSSVWAFDYTDIETYENNYFYDYSINDGLNSTVKMKTGANIFTSKKDNEYVKAVNVGFLGKNVTCDVKVYTNLTDADNPESGTLTGTGSKTFEYCGYRTVELDSPVKVEKGADFSVVVSVRNPTDDAVVRVMQYANGKTYRYKDYWSKINFAARIKAFTSSIETPPAQTYDISDALINLSEDAFVYNGKAHEPSVTVFYNGAQLVSGRDYTVSYANNVNSGRADVSVKGMGNYKGSKTIHFTVVQANSPPEMPNTVLTVNGNVTSLSEIQLPNGWQWKYENTALNADGDTEAVAVYYDSLNYKNYETAIVIKRSADTASPPYDISDAQINLSEDAFVYNGKAHEPLVTVFYNGAQLVSGRDYTVSYANNVNSGRADVNVKGIGNYKGSKTIHFTVAQANSPPEIPNTVLTVNGNVTSLSEIQLPNGWQWKYENTALNADGDTEAVAVYYDSLNYKNYETAIVIKRSADTAPTSPTETTENISRTGIIIGCVCGGLMLIGAVIFCIIFFLKKQKRE